MQPAGPLTPGGAEKLRESLNSARRGAPPAYTLQVSRIRRYVCDESVRGYTGANESVRNAFDLILSDGVGLVKVLLSPTLNAAIERYEVRETSIITVRSYRSLRFEREIGRAAIGVIMLFDLVERAAALVIPLQGQLSFAENSPEEERRDLPLATKRGFYLSLWSDDCPEGTDWDTFADDVTILGWPAEVMNNARMSIRQVKAEPRAKYVIGRVVRKLRLVQYTTRADQKQNFPMFFDFVIGDETDTILVTVWNKCCRKYINALRIGQFVLLTGARLKPSRIDGAPQLALNPGESKLFIVSPDIARSVMPVFPWKFATIDDLAVADRSFPMFDLAALIAAVGPMMRERNKDGQIIAYRWLLLRDQSSSAAIHLKAYVNSQLAEFDLLSVGTVVAFTDLVVAVPEHVICSTHSTQYLLSTEVPTSEDVVAATVEWARAFRLPEDDSPFYSFENIEDLLHSWPAHPVSSFGDISKRAESLQYLECHQTLVQCYIRSIKAATSDESGKRAATQPTELILQLESINNDEQLEARLRLAPGNSAMEALLAMVEATAEDAAGLFSARERKAMLGKTFAAARTLFEKSIRSVLFVAALELYLAEHDDLRVSVVGLFGTGASVRNALRQGDDA